jgi:uncharacterized protein YjbI with pentapeptide repeats
MITKEKFVKTIKEKPEVFRRYTHTSSYTLNLATANLQGANLSGASLYRANLRRANLREADLRSAALQCTIMHGAVLYNANLQGADLRGTNLRGAILRLANLCNADLYGAVLYKADLCGTNLRDADLQYADMRGANLRGANLYGANLYCADLRGADLQDACLNATELCYTDLQGAVLTGTIIDPDAPVPDTGLSEYLAEQGVTVNKHGMFTGYRTSLSAFAEVMIYSAGRTYTAPVFSISTEDECHPGLHLCATLDECKNEYHYSRYIKVVTNIRNTMLVGGNIRTKRFRVMERVT